MHMKVQKSTAAAVILLMLTAFALARYSIRSITAVSPSFEAFEAPPTIIIDAGHGESVNTKHLYVISILKIPLYFNHLRFILLPRMYVNRFYKLIHNLMC